MQSTTSRSAAVAVAAVAFSAAYEAAAGANTATPVQKVIELLNGMLAKGNEEKQNEMVAFAGYKQFCDDTASEKQKAVTEANEQIDLLKADIEKYTVDAADLGVQVAALEEDISVWNGDIKAATRVRDIEKADYDAMHQDYSESVDALGRAIEVLKKQAYNRKQASSFSQVSALQGMRLIPPAAKRAIEVFLGQDPESNDVGLLAVGAPEAHGYEFRSSAIIETLEKLMDKFISERTALEKAEMDSQHAFDLLIQDLTSGIEQATQDSAEKSELKAKALQHKADSEGNLQDTTTTRDADVKYLNDLVATCETKATDFESRQTLRSEELHAVEQAIGIISGGSVAGHAETYLPTLLQQKKAAKGAALASLRADATSPVQEKVAEFLGTRSRELGSRVLSMLAARVATDPFQKVKKLVKDLIVRLMEEATEEATHKGWCDTELGTNEQTRKQKTQKVEVLHAEIDELEASISTLSEDLSELSQAVADLDAAMADATRLRNEEKAVNTKTTADAEEAQNAVAQALTVLKEFYAKAGEATALLQKQARGKDPEVFNQPYTGMQAQGGGVISMLEVIMSDFGRLEADTKSAEASSQKEYDGFMEDSKVDKAAKTSDISHKSAKVKDQKQTLGVKKADLEGTQKELTAAMAYYDKLKPSCVDSGVSYDDRVSRRKEEIESLQEALRILNGEDVA